MTTQTWNAAAYAHNARFVADFGSPLVELLNPQGGEAVLDLGCGDGALTAKIAATGARVLGVDGSADMVAATQALGLNAQVENGEALPFAQQFDAVFSNAALHWMTRPDDVLAGVKRALRPGGRFVAEFGGHGNVASIVVALQAVVMKFTGAPASFHWYFPTVEEYSARLVQHGFVIDSIALVYRPTPLPTGMEGWLETFARPFFGAVAPDKQAAALAETVDLLRHALCDADGQWIADYVRLRVVAHLL